MSSWKKFSRVSDFLDYNIEKRGDFPYMHEKISNTWNTYTMRDTVFLVRKMARYLEKNGFAEKHIALYGINSFNWAVAYLTIIGYCGICFPINRQYRQNDLRHILLTADISLFLYDENASDIIADVAVDFPEINFVSFEKLFSVIETEETSYLSCSRSKDAVSCILYTSGTSSIPKAVMLSQSNLFFNSDELFNQTPMNENDRLLLTLPMSHVYAGVTAFLYSIISGMQIYFGSFDIKQTIYEFVSVQPTVYIAVPLQMQRILKYANLYHKTLKEFTGNHLKYFYCGGAPIEHELKNVYINEGIPIIEGYGLSETSSVIALDTPFKYEEGSVGKTFKNIDVKIDHPDINGCGEIVIKGGNVMHGYYKNPQLNHEVFTDDGYFRSGDIGKIDANHHLFIIGRKKKMIVTANGENVSIDELEQYFSVPGINKVLIYTDGQHILMKSWYVGELENLEKIIKDKNEQLPKYKKIISWELVPDKLGERLK